MINDICQLFTSPAYVINCLMVTLLRCGVVGGIMVTFRHLWCLNGRLTRQLSGHIFTILYQSRGRKLFVSNIECFR